MQPMGVHPHPTDDSTDDSTDGRADAVKAVALHLAATADAAITKAWRDQRPATAHGDYDLALVDFYEPKVRGALRQRYSDGDIRAAIITAQQALPPLPGGIRKAARSDADERADRARIAAAVAAALAGRGITDLLRRVLRNIWIDSWVTGRHVAERQVADLPKPRRPHPVETGPQTQTGGTGGRPPAKPPTAVGGDEPRDLPEYRTPTIDHDATAPEVGIGGHGDDGVFLDVDWGRWEPGWAEAADRVAHGELARELDRLDITLRGIDRTTVDRIGDRIADGLLNGDPIDKIARSVNEVLGDRKRAQMIAHTETARAMTAATFDGYREAGITRWDWIASEGACPACAAREAGSPYPLGAPGPPQHPRCRCAAGPAIDD